MLLLRVSRFAAKAISTDPHYSGLPLPSLHVTLRDENISAQSLAHSSCSACICRLRECVPNVCLQVAARLESQLLRAANTAHAHHQHHRQFNLCLSKLFADLAPRDSVVAPGSHAVTQLAGFDARADCLLHLPDATRRFARLLSICVLVLICAWSTAVEVVVNGTVIGSRQVRCMVPACVRGANSIECDLISQGVAVILQINGARTTSNQRVYYIGPCFSAELMS